jgi:hypothetical protein
VIDLRAEVLTTEVTTRLTDSICMAADNPKVVEVTATALTDSESILLELWATGGYVIDQFLITGDAARRLAPRLTEPRGGRRVRLI